MSSEDDCVVCGEDASDGSLFDEFVKQQADELDQLIAEYGGSYDIYYPRTEPTQH